MQKKLTLIFMFIMLFAFFGISYAETECTLGDYKIIGRPNDFSSKGAAYIQKCNGTDWYDFQTLTASDAENNDYFGYAVYISGYYAIIGARYDNVYSGSAYIFKLENNAWKQDQKITAIDGANHDYFGTSVCINNTYAIVGAVHDDDKATNSGSAYIYILDNNTWTQSTKIRGTEQSQLFGHSVLLTENSIIIKDYNGLSYTYPFQITISGYIKNPKNTPQSDVTISFSNNGSTTSTDSAGYYSHELTIGYSGLATPNKPGYKFSPASAI